MSSISSLGELDRRLGGGAVRRPWALTFSYDGHIYHWPFLPKHLP
jgi:hypothetical protein